MSVAFSLDGVSVDFGQVRALDGVSLSVSPGERVALVGPSGGGKTTLLRLLNGMQSATTGRVQALGADLATLGPREMRAVRAQIAFIHQQLALVPNLRVLQNVVMGRLGRRSFAGALRDVLWCPRAEVERIHALLGRVGIPEKLYHRTDHLSGGQQQRVAVARALYQNPVALLADEPVSSIDPARARDTVSLLTELSREHGLTLCMSLHHLELAREFFPRLIGLRQGRVVFDRAAADLSGDEFSRLYDLTRDELIDA